MKTPDTSRGIGMDVVPTSMPMHQLHVLCSSKRFIGQGAPCLLGGRMALHAANAATFNHNIHHCFDIYLS